MAFLAVSRRAHLSPSVFKLPLPISVKSLFFCTSPSSQSLNPTLNEDLPTPEKPVFESSPLREAAEPTAFHRQGTRRRSAEKIEDVICRMMASRAWTTRLQNSIRNLVGSFDHELVYNVLHGAKSSEHALQFFRWVERSNLFHHNRETHHKIIEILGRDSKHNHARCILLDMPKKGLRWDEDLWVLLIDSYGMAGIVQESVKLFNKMKELGVERGLKSYDILFKVISRRGRYMMSKRYFNKMLAEGIEPTRHTFNILIWGFFLSGKFETANRFFEDMKNRGIAPDVVTYNTLINGYYRVKKIDQAEKCFVEMKGRNIEPSVITYTTLIKGCVSVEQVDDALRLFEEMKGFGINPNTITYSTLLPGLCDAERMPEARNVLKEMVDNHIPPKDNSIFERLISSQCKMGNLDAALDVLKAMIRLSVPTEAGHYGILIENCCKAGEFDRAVKLLDKLLEKDIILRPRSTLRLEPSAYNPLIHYLCNNGQTLKAEILMRQLMKLGEQDLTTLNSLIHGHSQEESPESGFEILQIMLKRKINPEKASYDSLIQSYLKKNEPAEAKTVLDSMVESGHLPGSSLYRSVIESLFDDGRVQTASRVMKMMLEKGVTDHQDLVFKVLEALFARGHVEEALGRIELLMQSGVAVDLDQILSALCEKGKTIAALKLLDYGLERDYDIQMASCEKVLDALLAAGKTLNAYSILCKLMGTGGGSDWSSCKDLIKCLNEEGNTKQADILSRMITGKDKRIGSKKSDKKRSTMAC